MKSLTFEAAELALETAISKLADVMGKPNFPETHHWVRSLLEVRQALLAIANAPGAMDRFSTSLRQRWSWRYLDRDEVISVIGEALAIDISRYSGEERDFPAHSFIGQYRQRREDGKEGWRVTAALCFLVGSIDQPKRGGEIHWKMKGRKREFLPLVGNFAFDPDSISHEPDERPTSRLLEHLELVAEATSKFAAEHLPPKQKEAVLAHLAGRPIGNLPNLRYGFITIASKLLESLEPADGRAKEICLAVLGGQSERLQQISSAEIDTAKWLLLTRVSRQRLRAFLMLVPVTLTKAWLRNAVAAGLVIGSVAARATMMC